MPKKRKDSKKQFTNDKKLEALEYRKTHTLKDTCEQFDCSTSSLDRWKKQLELGNDLTNKTGYHAKTGEHKKKLSNGKLYFNTKDISALSREELEEYAEFWAIVGKWKRDLMNGK